MFNKIQKLFSPKQVAVPVNKLWRQGMWVIYNEQPHILFKLGEPALIHSVDRVTGETTGQIQVSLDALRQAKWGEIPEVRRKISFEKAQELGYAP